MVISTGMTVPRWLSVAALYCLQNSIVCTPCGPSAVPTGGAGVAAPAGSWILTMAATRRRAMEVFLFLSLSTRRSELGDLAELELDRCLTAEDVDEHLELQLVLVDFRDLAGEVGERTLLDPDRVANLMLEARLGSLRSLGPLGSHLQDRLHLRARQR